MNEKNISIPINNGLISLIQCLLFPVYDFRDGIFQRTFRIIIFFKLIVYNYFLQKETYHGDRNKADLLTFVLGQVKSTIVYIDQENFDTLRTDEEKITRPWLISFCGDGGGRHIKWNRRRRSLFI